MSKTIKSLQKKIKYSFLNPDLLQQALVHRSYLNEHPDFYLGHNERLEFLGDAVLELVVTEFLYETYPNKPEGELTSLRASLVNTRSLSRISSDFDLNDYLFLSKGEAKDSQDSKARQIILANAVEAIIGALYLDGGIKASRDFIQHFAISKLDYILEHKLYIDPKSHLQEIAQEKVGVTPTYRVLAESGPDHEKVFKVGVYFGKSLIAEGHGTSKQLAQEDAAEKALTTTIQ